MNGVINSVADGVITQCTSWPSLMRAEAMSADLYAAMEPVMPSTIVAIHKVRPKNLALRRIKCKQSANGSLTDEW